MVLVSRMPCFCVGTTAGWTQFRTKNSRDRKLAPLAQHMAVSLRLTGKRCFLCAATPPEPKPRNPLGNRPVSLRLTAMGCAKGAFTANPRSTDVRQALACRNLTTNEKVCRTFVFRLPTTFPMFARLPRETLQWPPPRRQHGGPHVTKRDSH